MTKTIVDVASPCVRNCCLDDNDVCLGCGRSLPEIIGWSASSNLEKQTILSAATERLQRALAVTKNSRANLE